MVKFILINKHTRTWYLQVRAHQETVELMNILEGNLRSLHKLKQYQKWKNLIINRTLFKRKWTKEEENKLIELIKEGVSYEEIAKKLDRTILSIKNRNWTKFNIPYKYEWRQKIKP